MVPDEKQESTGLNFEDVTKYAHLFLILFDLSDVHADGAGIPVP